MQVLVTLAERPGEVVSRDELMAKVWAGVFVTDDALHRAIRELRRLFDDDSEQPTRDRDDSQARLPLDRADRGHRKAVGRPRRKSAVGQARRQPLGGRVPRPAMIAVAALLICVAAGALIVGRSLGPRPMGIIEARVRFMPLTSDPGNEVSPALSASGRLAYVARGDRRPRAHLHQRSRRSPLRCR